MTTDPHDTAGRAPDPGRVGGEAAQVGRVYDYLLGGALNIAADRAVGDQVLAIAPDTRLAVQANRAFLARAVRYALAQGVTQLLDLGCGLPSAGNVHEIAHTVNPQARVVYVDVDPLAVQAMRTRCADLATVAVIAADLRDPATVLTHPYTRRLIDPTQPVAILLVSVLHFLPGNHTDVVAAYRDATTPGSLLAISTSARPSAPTRPTRYRPSTPTPAHPSTSAPPQRSGPCSPAFRSSTHTPTRTKPWACRPAWRTLCRSASGGQTNPTQPTRPARS